jgi:Secretion system C-terminal sorting domain/Regulator of chromosome condensation (RCC1) repeat
MGKYIRGGRKAGKGVLLFKLTSTMKRIGLLSLLLAGATCATAQTYTHTECGTEFTIALRSDSTLWGWGFNGNEQLGLTGVSSTDTPMQMEAGQKWILAATGSFHTLAVAADSTLWAWGLGANGQLGTGSAATSQPPAQVSSAMHWRAVSGGEGHTIGILGNGTLWATGYNAYGELGTGDTTGHTSFVQIGTAQWRMASAGGVFTMAIQQNGTLWGWGYNADGELGLNTTANTYWAPTQVGTDTDWAMVSCGFQYTLALKRNGTIWATGFNGNGQLGVTSTTMGTDSVLARVGADSDWVFVAAGSSFGYAIKSNGTLWGWGYNSEGQLGTTPTVSASIQQIGTDTDWHYISGADGAISGGSLFGLHGAGLKNVPTGVCTAGADYEGQLGNGTTISLPGGQAYFDCSPGEVPGLAVATVAPLAGTTLFPDPASSQITISSNVLIRSAVISNVAGQVLLTTTPNTTSTTVSVASLAPGIYLVRINDSEVKRFVKE